MMPARQRLEPGEAVIGEAHEGLEVEFELAPFDRLPEVGFHAEEVAGGTMRARLVDLASAAAAGLCRVQGEIGVADQVLGIAARGEGRRDPDAGTDEIVAARNRSEEHTSELSH